MSADAKSVQDPEHPSGLRDAIEAALLDYEDERATEDGPSRSEVERIEASVLAWLSVVSEGQRNVLQELTDAADEGVSDCVDADAALRLNAAIRVARRLLFTRIESDENGGTK